MLRWKGKKPNPRKLRRKKEKRSLRYLSARHLIAIHLRQAPPPPPPPLPPRHFNLPCRWLHHHRPLLQTVHVVKEPRSEASCAPKHSITYPLGSKWPAQRALFISKSKGASNERLSLKIQWSPKLYRPSSCNFAKTTVNIWFSVSDCIKGLKLEDYYVLDQNLQKISVSLPASSYIEKHIYLVATGNLVLRNRVKSVETQKATEVTPHVTCLTTPEKE